MHLKDIEENLDKIKHLLNDVEKDVDKFRDTFGALILLVRKAREGNKRDSVKSHLLIEGIIKILEENGYNTEDIY